MQSYLDEKNHVEIQSSGRNAPNYQLNETVLG